MGDISNLKKQGDSWGKQNVSHTENVSINWGLRALYLGRSSTAKLSLKPSNMATCVESQHLGGRDTKISCFKSI